MPSSIIKTKAPVSKHPFRPNFITSLDEKKTSHSNSDLLNWKPEWPNQYKRAVIKN